MPVSSFWLRFSVTACPPKKGGEASPYKKLLEREKDVKRAVYRVTCTLYRVPKNATRYTIHTFHFLLALLPFDF